MFHAGEEGSRFYVIISGSCAVLSPVVKPSGETEYKQLALLRQGECFGELALLTYKPRAASVICREETHLAVLERNDYLRVLGKTHKGALQSKLALLMQLPIFAKWSKTALQGLSYFFKERTYKRHQVLFQAGQLVKEVYLVVQGEFQLSKHIHQASKSVPCHPMARLQIDVTLLTTGELVGAEEIIRSLPHRYSCMCRSTQGEVLCIAREDFLGRVTNEETVSYLRSMNETKEVYRHQRIVRLTQLAHEEKAVLLGPQTRKFSQSPDFGESARDALLREKANLSKLPGVPAFQLQKVTRTESLPECITERPRLSARDLEQFHSQSPSKFDPSPLFRQTTWDQIVLRKYPINKKSPKFSHSRQSSVVNIHTQSLRAKAAQPRQEERVAGPVTSRALSHINLKIEEGQITDVS